MFKKIVCFMVAITFLSTNFALALKVDATSVVLMDSDNFELLHFQNEETVLPMASTTKIMTALVVLENTNLDKIVEIKPEYTYIEGSSMYLEANEKVTIKELLYGLMLMSGNDSAIALAHETTGDYGDFIELMNKKASEYGLVNTHFDNPNGLDSESHYTTAYDLAKLTSIALKNETFCEIVATKYYVSDTRTMKNHNKLLWESDEFIGVKTGYTSLAGRCLVSAISIDGKILVAVTLDCSNDWQAHKSLYDTYKEKYNKFNFYTNDEIYDIIRIMSGNMSNCEVVLQENVNLLLTQEQKNRITTVVNAPKIVYAPIDSGDKYGEICFILDGHEIFKTNLLFSNNITLEYVDDENIFMKFINFIKQLFE